MQNLNDALVSIISSASSGIQTGISFLSQQIPDVIRQLLLFNLIRDLVMVGLDVVVFTTIVVLLCWAWRTVERKIPNPEYDPTSLYSKEYILVGWDPEKWCGAVIFGGVFSVILLISAIVNFIGNFQEVLELWLAPKVWLIEYAATLIKH